MTALYDVRSRSSEDNPLLPAYRILLRIAREKKAQRGATAKRPPGGQKEGAGRANPTPSEVQHPSDEVSACLSSPF
jgi:hypothetical protein